MNETEKPTHSLIFELSHEDLNFKLLRSNDGLETLLVNGEALQSERRLQSYGEYQLGHPELGKLVVRYQIFSDQNICRFMLLHEDELLNQGQVDIEESLVDEINGHAPQERPSGNSKIGLIGLAFKLFKSAKTIKVVLAGTALAGYSIIFSWQFALALILVLCFHEYGHVWAMKRSGLKTKGFYLIPFVGGMAIGDRASSHWQHVFISMMGPCFGLLMSAACYVTYLITGNHFIGLLASISALLNMFNLLPVLPLDGGQVVKSMVFSGRSYWPYLGLMIISAALFALSLQLGLALLSFFIVIGALDLLFSWREFKHQTVAAMDRYGILFSLAWYLLTLAAFVFIILSIASDGLPGSEIATAVLNS
ncbi:MAG: site-2 protease family protein [Cellvibrionaceae bacterium]|nr:site-2 protease family protein [Cellvibrionaceae bacterium]